MSVVDLGLSTNVNHESYQPLRDGTEGMVLQGENHNSKRSVVATWCKALTTRQYSKCLFLHSRC